MSETSYVFFATGNVYRPPYPPLRERFLTWLTRFLTGGRVAHTLFATGGAVLDGTFGGNRYYDLAAVIRAYPTLCTVFKVPHPNAVGLDNWLAGVGIEKPIWPTISRWLGSKRWTNDCLCVVLECLFVAGVPVPLMDLTTPTALYDWLKENGFERLEIRPGPQRDLAALAEFCSD